MRPSFYLAIPFSIGLSLIVGGCTPQASLPDGPSSLPSSTIGADDEDLAETYIGQNIGSLSPQAPSLGGSFYVTGIEFPEQGRAIVKYEDGHNALTGEARYTVNNGIVTITSFDVIEQDAQSSSQAGS